MSLREYLGDRSVFLLLHASFFVFASTLLFLVDTAAMLLVFFFCSWFVPLAAYIASEFIRQRGYFTELDRLTDSLDQKYLLVEMMGVPERAEEEFLHELLRRINKDMHEHVKNYRDRENDYREYIETWVHEIKNADRLDPADHRKQPERGDTEHRG